MEGDYNGGYEEEEETGEGGDAAMDAHTLTKAPVLELEAPNQGEGEVYYGSQEGDRNPIQG